jgi:hypothetical protein
MKKIEQKYSLSSGTSKEMTPFEQMKSSLRNNLKGLRKQDDEGEK